MMKALVMVGPVCFVGIETVDGRVVDEVTLGILPIPVISSEGPVGKVFATSFSYDRSIVYASALVDGAAWDKVRNSEGGLYVAPDLIGLESYYRAPLIHVTGRLAGLTLCGTNGAWGKHTYLLPKADR